MSICADLGPDLIAHERGELEGEALVRLREHLANCPSCAAESTATAAFLAGLRSATEIEPSDAEIATISVAVDEALEAAQLAPVLEQPSFLRGAWETAVSRYETSDRFRRVTLGSIGVHAAAAAVLGWLLIGGGVRQRRPQITIAELEPAVVLDDHAMVYEAATPEGVPLPGVFAPKGAIDIRFPTRGIRAHLAIAGDPVQKAARLRERLGDELAVRASNAIERGLRRLDPGANSDVATTGAIVLAFATDGHSARVGESAERLRPAVRKLEGWLENAATTHALKTDVDDYSLAVRALTWQWALDFRHLSRDERRVRQGLLQRAGEQLVARQEVDGGFGDALASHHAVAALADLRLAGVMRPDEALAKASGYLDRGDRRGDRRSYLALAAVKLAYPRELGVRADAATTLDALAARLADPAAHDALLAVAGLQALVRHQRPLGKALTAMLAAQQDDGSWRGGDDRTTALGVLAVARGYMPDS